MQNQMIKRVLISVTDKTGVMEFAKVLKKEFDVEIISTGGTAKTLSAGGVDVRPIDDLTGFPEMMDGRVKTLHPRVHGGLLARRDTPSHMKAAAKHGISMIDMVVVNLYAFEATVAKKGVAYEEAIENIDIGGPSMLRSAAKNHAAVTVVTNPADYDDIIKEMRANGGATTLETRQRLALEAFTTTSSYDYAISRWLGKQISDAEPPLLLVGGSAKKLRYGENPHQAAMLYTRPNATLGQLAVASQLQGKELSYNNWLDLDAAWSAVREFAGDTACVIVKHQTPCGIARGRSAVTAYTHAFKADPISAFGGVMAFNTEVPAGVIRTMLDNGHFVEAIVAPGYAAAALELLKTKPNIRVINTAGATNCQSDDTATYRSIDGGILELQADKVDEDPNTFIVPTKRQPTATEREQLLFAWKCAKSVKSNAIVIAKNDAMIGAGAGQPNRVNSARIAVEQAGKAAKGAVAASDAFMPFADSLEVLIAAGVTAVIQPGGSIRDNEVIAAADKAGVAILFTGVRHFRH